MTKEEARKMYSQKRIALTNDEKERYNLELMNRFFLTFDFSRLKIIHFYLPITKKNEPDTWSIIKRLRTDYQHIQISIPKMRERKLENFFFEGEHQLIENSYGILEPQYGKRTPTRKIDLVVVPLLTFDKQMHRVGYGKGYYDRFLRVCRKGCIKAGISFFSPIDRIENTTRYDMRLHRVITPEWSW